MTIELLAEVEILKEKIERYEKSFNKIRAEIERLHYHPKLDFVRNDEVVDMALDIIDKCRAESEGKG